MEFYPRGSPAGSLCCIALSPIIPCQPFYTPILGSLSDLFRAAQPFRSGIRGLFRGKPQHESNVQGKSKAKTN
jgi:hypothetical protein